ncbi:ribosome maturation factor RimP [Thiohalophilus thiocyanatoxydans]|uniref:Ribosome maturation factor RimP n=1 Tax=Thiohalophilus thiocyanatoxydans TaxID=381308 RepID=A0A4R8INW1_9GAMM|nr:ribosome maturation factor RimP [Thiohalophilus thiocyanatoxydans]TDY02576.1 ribosome maturation factor RimP [Thiohalophilus thiocyanatoxydans]
MGQATDKLTTLIASAVQALDYELVGVEHQTQGKHSVVRVFIDSEEGVTLADCEQVSHQISGVLDVEDPIRGRYNLEVSSPGLDRPLFTPEHYTRFLGEKVKLRLRHAVEGRRKLAGRIDKVEGEVVHITDDAGQTYELTMDEIEKANLVPDYDAIIHSH